LGKVVHTVKRAGTYAAKVSHKELHKIAVHVRAVINPNFIASWNIPLFFFMWTLAFAFRKYQRHLNRAQAQ